MTTPNDTRRALGPVGVYLPVEFADMPPISEQREAAQRLERAGYTAIWVNEVLGKDAFTQVAALLAATDRVVFGTGIVNIWVREPQTAHAAAATLAEAYPGRFVLGLGVGYPEQARAVGREFGSPVATLRDYLSRMSEPGAVPAPRARYPRIIGAMGPKLTALGAEMADGTFPAMRTPEYTAETRKALGPDKLLIVGIDNAAQPQEVADQVRQHRDAGADHVVLMSSARVGLAARTEELAQLAPE
ncbi:LLM class flavin-dependent oxidoreductase [Saccharopolyspora flava]|uniref:Probable F420-dependent oxidoreductase, MSMEG_4141 family n=1 Tax=Saccharopolyspora flava TaxID=95161 RepID=A0A1I6RMR8_9PSEU|nr:LLM class flavin-dependent oxidoreductase [Saccharopolyspora flava]SFS65982.1 probable F420-dependent oxidoreductase, MSMEG_4141 family [Saccharopolyspora flava]